MQVKAMFFVCPHAHSQISFSLANIITSFSNQVLGMNIGSMADCPPGILQFWHIKPSDSKKQNLVVLKPLVPRQN
jgi:hypothetical protein